ncbi:hypothetical protein CRD60_00670 [Bifidobacterium aemilianum]|uniref:VWFA domain-containing protein n=1 Tax=Bifidobacterium aemilianum TaxID=2493120 RepID=A0A366K9J0_9BIFI|nr:VWA domain-containing protein [Bifidobacterium aemilianum]RBP98415.1 hypothetical protein CRD60_00670 [Bifidobacterium aemilianum]
MNGFTLSPALGWIAGGVLAVLLLAMAVTEILLYTHRRGSSDETLPACIRRVLICLLAALMVLTPSQMVPTANRAVNKTDVMLAVDVTGSMAVQDAQYGSDTSISRLEAAKSAVRDLTDAYANASFSALRFGASGTLDVPLTPDTMAIDNWADSLAPEASSVSSGSNLDVAIDPLLLALKSIRGQHPDDTIVLYVISDGEQTSTKTPRTFSSLRQYLNDAFTLGVGSTKGGRIPLISDKATGGAPGAGKTDEWVKDPTTGQPGISAMDPKTLKEIADQMGGSYLALTKDQIASRGVSSKMSKHWRVTQSAKERQRAWPIVWPLAIVMTALLAWELGAWIAKSRRLL